MHPLVRIDFFCRTIFSADYILILLKNDNLLDSTLSEVNEESKESSILNFVNSRNNITFACEELFECMVL